LALLVRLGLAAVALAAALPKFANLRGSRKSVAAYQLFPPELDRLIAVGLPVLELVVAVLLVTGLMTRYAAALFGAMLVAFIAGIASAWARGLKIACGCFDEGGELAAGQQAQYGLEILRDVGLVALAVFLVIWPRSPFSLDRLFSLEPVPRGKKV
jgi:uncharacterized membrane protein YphA (DoxX/SURF4 family)